MKVVVVGAGALGTILAAHLSQAGHPVTVLARGNRGAQVQRNGLVVSGLSALSESCKIVSDPDALSAADLLILTVKTYDNEAVIDTLPPHGFETTFSVANGVLKNAQLIRRFGANSVLGCMANTSGELLENGVVRFTRNVCLHIGELSGEISQRSKIVATTLNQSGIKTRSEPNIQVIEWSKFVGWTALLVLSVITRSSTGKFLADSRYAELATFMIKEMAAISRANNIQIVDQSPLPVASIASATHDRGREIVMEVGNELCISAPEHRMSSLQDLERGRPLEVEETLGFALTEARRLGIKTPCLVDFYKKLSGLGAD